MLYVVSGVSAFLLVLWITGKVASLMEAGRPGMSWAFVTFFCSGVISLLLSLAGLIEFPIIFYIVVNLMTITLFAFIFQLKFLGAFVTYLVSGVVSGVLVFVVTMVAGVGAFYGGEADTHQAAMTRGEITEEDSFETAEFQLVSFKMDETIDQKRSPASGNVPDQEVMDKPTEASGIAETESVLHDRSQAIYREIAFVESPIYLQQRVRIKRKDGKKIQGVLVLVEDEMLYVRHAKSGGYIDYPVASRDIRTLEAFDRAE